MPDTRPPLGGLPEGGQIRRLALIGTKGAVGRSRDFTRQALHDWSWLPGVTDEQQEVAEDVLLLVSELVTNANLHAGGAVELLLHGTKERLRVEVSDDSLQQPVPRTPYQASRPGGHGLHIIARLSDAWGSELRATGKSVWIEVATP
ncbi:ATP-binding protein [Streptacidiphilus sp. PB12-B1b]|uniref:ATP-binding protein n=1 Tax=Streptacidiphilus sp. PB12-B1b TaxID=2705012 RepID=UPI0015FC7D03|nr:ATP-binding protein [Streptacidiphilus sp. PB12-B1b]QMU77075.1 ATP-binding protein [Streptacidiphilus sp. PB12-B1b]